MIIVIGGTPGSGKSTAVELLSETHGLKVLSSGKIFRDEAVRRGMTLLEFSKFAQKHSNIDQDLDRKMTQMVLEMGQAGDLIVDSRLQAYLLEREGAKFFGVHVDAPLQIRAERVANREAKTVEQAMKEISERERSEKARYIKFYRIDIGDLSVYDLLLDSSDKNPQEVADAIWSRVPR